MSKVICKGTTLKQTISASLTAVAQVISLEISGAEAETYDSTTLDGGYWKSYDLTGYSEPGEVSGELFYDPALAGHKALTTLMGVGGNTTAQAQNAMQIVYADDAATTQSFTAASVAFGVTADMADGLKGKFKIKISGDPGFPHS
jgi:hypothetical protein